jgi:hypothetical protein
VKVLAVILLLSCIWDIAKTIRTIEKGRRGYKTKMPNTAYLWYMLKKTGVVLGLNIAAAIFFIVYLVG